jgi:hypothetical protein
VDGKDIMTNARRGWTLAALWVLSLVAVSALSAGAQVPRQPPVPREAPLLASPTILTGDDVGFRLDRVRDGVPVGRVVIRVDGRWVEPQAR